MEPMVRIVVSKSEHPNLQSGATMSLGIANRVIVERDAFCSMRNEIEFIAYTVTCMLSDRECSYNIAQELGDGTGAAINQIRASAQRSMEEMKLYALLGLNVFGTHIVKKKKALGMEEIARQFHDVALPMLEEYSKQFEDGEIKVS